MEIRPMGTEIFPCGRTDMTKPIVFFFCCNVANPSNKWLNEKWRLERNAKSPLSIVSDVWRFMNGVCLYKFQVACPLRDSWKRSPGVVVYIVIGVRTPGLGVGFVGRLPEQHCAWVDCVCVGLPAHMMGSASVESCYASRRKRNANRS